MQKRLVAIAGAGAALLVTGGAAAAGVLPDAAQDGLARAGERVGITLPATREDHPGGPGDDVLVEEPEVDDDLDDEALDDELDDAEDDELDDELDDAEGDAETPDAANFGQMVSEAARSGQPQEDGRAFGEWVSESAREAHGPETHDGPQGPQGPPSDEDHPGNRPDDVPRGQGRGRP